MNIRAVVRWVLLGFGGLVAFCGLALVGLYIYITEPYLSVTEVRLTSTPKTVKLQYIVACEGAFYELGTNVIFDPQLPDGAPELPSEAFLVANTFVFTGYPYKALIRNIVTGRVTESHSRRFDTVEWHLITPYVVWDSEKDEEVTKDAPLGWRASSAQPAFVAMAPKLGSSCS
jgi:hypothetical protein